MNSFLSPFYMYHHCVEFEFPWAEFHVGNVRRKTFSFWIPSKFFIERGFMYQSDILSHKATTNVQFCYKNGSNVCLGNHCGCIWRCIDTWTQRLWVTLGYPDLLDLLDYQPVYGRRMMITAFSRESNWASRAILTGSDRDVQKLSKYHHWIFSAQRKLSSFHSWLLCQSNFQICPGRSLQHSAVS